MHDIAVDMKASRAAAPGEAPKYRPDIDGLRAIAVTSVVLYHAGLPWLPSGFVGVDIFFVISGFLIGGIIYRDVTARRFSYANFYARRAKRILPALFAVVAFVVLAGLLLTTPTELAQIGASATTALLALSNMFFWWTSDYFAQSAKLKPLMMTWSLGVEEQFYFVFPVILLMMRRLARSTVLLVLAALSLASFALSIWLTYNWPDAAFYILLNRAWELGAGALLAISTIDRRPGPSGSGVQGAGIVGLAMLCLSIVAFGEDVPFPGYVALLPVVGTVLIIWAQESWVNQRILASRPLVAIGLISYSWYLWHWPLMSFARIVSPVAPSPAAMAMVTVLSLVLAVLSWRFVEQPFRHSATGSAATLRRYGLATLIAALATASLYALHGLPARVPDAMARRTGDTSRPCLVREGATSPRLGSPCQATGENRVALIGDSHADALAPMLRQNVTGAGRNLDQFTKASCPALDAVTRSIARIPEHARQCAEFSEAVLKQVVSDPGVTTVVIANFWSAPFSSEGHAERYVPMVGGRVADEARLLADGIARTVRRLEKAGKRVVVLGDAPPLDFDSMRVVDARSMRLRHGLGEVLDPEPGITAETTHVGHVSPEFFPTTSVVRKAAIEAGADYVDLASVLCTGPECRIAEAGTPFYVDHHHLSDAGAAYAFARLRPHW
jgi:peptidoglycan/LPS O-acetylase OafA/YrhL